MGNERLFSTVGIIGDTGHLLPSNIRSSVEFISKDVRALFAHQTVIMHALDPPRRFVEDLVLLGACAGATKPQATYIIAEEASFHDWLDLSKMMKGRSVFVITSSNTTETYKYINNICGLRSTLEHRFFQGLCINGLGTTVESQKSIGSFWVDFLFPKDSVIVEVDGSRYHSKEEDKQRDISKRRALMQLGYSVMTYTDTEINANLNGCISELRNFIKLRSLEKNI